MADGAVRFDLLFGIFATATIIASCAVGVGVIAFRKSHLLIHLFERITRRRDPLGRDEAHHGTVARINLIALSVILLWISFIIFLTGLRAFMAPL